MPTVQVLAFDIYGTLLDTSSISQALVEHAGLGASKAAEVSTLWRRYQLEYTWRLNSMKIYEPWNIVTKKSLIHAAKDFGLSFEDAVTEKVMKAYENLECFPDAPGALKELQASEFAKVLVFSNGTQHMITEALKFGTIHSFVAGSYVADSVQVYKPAPEIYKGLIKHVGKEANPGQCWLVSGNPFDVSGARAQGMNAIWVDRAKKGWADQLGLGPTRIVNDLREIPALIQSMSSRL